ncbi:hypothetical protein HUT18_29530 [Streptomyces sp. NA04227]|uniref:hypothetical protein n=1 Tax=Streptomyces sp. NA04227 TaxID=2742136 RepID=UPI00159297F3|nr:hypothetical protein [Streptomyces sp. NA04227]QKW09937.1 hypothetical protein HUT18_29530 [Streptomyces sp. NA04227]
MRFRHIRLREVGLRAAALGAVGALAFATPGLAHSEPSERPAATSSAECTPFRTATADGTEEWGSCLKVALRLSEAPAVGRSARLDIEITGTAARSDVRLDVELPAGLEWQRAPRGLTSTTAASEVPAHRGQLHRAEGRGHAGKEAPWRLSGTVKAVASGTAEIRAVATSADGLDTDSGSVFLTVGAQRSGFGIAARDVHATAPAPAGASRAHTSSAHRPAGPNSGGTSAKSAASEACATGGWGYTDHLGADRVSANTQVRVYDADTKGPHELLASGLTGADGRFRLCFDNTDETGGGQEVYVRFGTENPNWMVRHTRTKRAFTFDTPVAGEVAGGGTVDVGAVRPADAALMRGVEAFDAANTGWNWKPGNCWDAKDSTCRRALINWAPDSTDGTYYSLQSNDVHLAAADPDANILVLHELGHGVMDDVYEDDFPSAPNCSPHYIQRQSSEGCAWTEGMATWFGAAALNDPTFAWPDGRTLDLEDPTWGSTGWENGDTVEGRVLGAMIDLGDSTNEPGDTCSENPAGPMWSTFLGHVSDTFRQYWAHRAQDGHDVGPAALDCLYRNTVDYRS